MIHRRYHNLTLKHCGTFVIIYKLKINSYELKRLYRIYSNGNGINDICNNGTI